MKKRILIYLLLLVLGTVVFASSPLLLKFYLKPKIEKALTYVFDMDVHVGEFYVRPFHGYARATEFVFENQAQFDRRPHFFIKAMTVNFKPFALWNKDVVIDNLVLNQAVYYLEREDIQEGPTTNASMWWHNIQEIRKRREKDDGKKGWTVTIRRMTLRDFTFIYNDESVPDKPKKYVFKKINGYVSDFHWPAEDPELLEQTVKLFGSVGEKDNAPFWIKGEANFATGQIGFNLKGKILDGTIAYHDYMFQDIPVDIIGGKFDLDVHAVCHLRALRAENELILKAMKVKMRPNAADFVSGIPIKTWVSIVEKEEEIHLPFLVNGDIRDPKFRYSEAFERTFREALRERMQKGFDQVKNSAAKIASQAHELVIDRPAQMLGGAMGKNKEVLDGQGAANRGEPQGES